MRVGAECTYVNALKAAGALLRLYERAAAAGAASEAALLAWPQLALRCGRAAVAVAAVQAATAAAPRSAAVWRQSLLLQAQQAVAQACTRALGHGIYRYLYCGASACLVSLTSLSSMGLCCAGSAFWAGWIAEVAPLPLPVWWDWGAQTPAHTLWTVAFA